VGSFLVVEMMRQGKSPEQACKMAVERVIKKHLDYKDLQVGFIALNKMVNLEGIVFIKDLILQFTLR
jgi:isoaspartyl peptidase/L-asparaginase-like protein (Ntn-hydrolase superfamily)